MFTIIEIALIELNGIAPEFALLFGIPDLQPLRRRLRLTVRRGGRAEIVVV